MLPRPASDEGWLAGLVASSLEGSLLEDPLPLPPQKWGEPSSSEGWCSPRSLLEDLGGVLEDPMFNPLVAWEPEQPDGAASASAPTAALPSGTTQLCAKLAKLTLGELPNCVLVSVLGHLDARMLCVLPAVAREWGELATDPQVRRLAPAALPRRP